MPIKHRTKSPSERRAFFWMCPFLKTVQYPLGKRFSKEQFYYWFNLPSRSNAEHCP